MSRRPAGLAPGATLEGAGQDERKYSTTNPVVRRLIDRWFARLRQVVGAPGGLVVDIGTGEGYAAAATLPPGAAVVAIDYRLDKLALARSRLDASLVRADAGLVPLPDGVAEVVTCIEVLEHLPDPGAAVGEMRRLAGGRCVVSVPWEPFFRLGNLCRGKNLTRLGNDPEHVQAFTPQRLRRLLAAHFGDVRVWRCFPWLVAEAR